MSRPRLLDLFCGAGGAAMGYHRAGFDVLGVDINPQPNYPFEFVEDDALAFLRGMIALASDGFGPGWSAIHASPPCQAHSVGRNMPHAGKHDDLIEPTRDLLRQSGLPYVIENVPGAPLCDYVTLCGDSLGLGSPLFGLARHRLFETNWEVGLVPPCSHGQREVLGVYGSRPSRSRGKSLSERSLPRPFAREQAKLVMGIDWMTSAEMGQAIPPAYTEFIGERLMAQIAVPA